MPADALRQFRDRSGMCILKTAIQGGQQSKTELGLFESLKHGVFVSWARADVDFGGVIKDSGATNYEGWIIVEPIGLLPGMGSPRIRAPNRSFLKGVACRNLDALKFVQRVWTGTPMRMNSRSQ